MIEEKNINPVHSFIIEDATRLKSIEKAILLKEIRQMSVYKIRMGKEPWVYYSGSALSKKFPYLSQKSIERWLSDMIEEGELVFIIKNKVKYDRTKSYTVPQFMKSVPQNEELTDHNEETIPPLSPPLSNTMLEDKSSSQEVPDFDSYMADEIGGKTAERYENEEVFNVWVVNGVVLSPARLADYQKKYEKKYLKRDEEPMSGPRYGMIEDIVAIWNRYPDISKTKIKDPINKTTKSYLLPPAKVVTTELKREITRKLKSHKNIDEWERSIKAYVLEIANRPTDGRYDSHRMSLYDFVYQKNGFIKYLNR